MQIGKPILNSAFLASVPSLRYFNQRRHSHRVFVGATYMRKFLMAILVGLIAFGAAFSQSPPTLRIVTETPGLPSELFYGDIKVKPLRLRPGTNTPITIDDFDFFVSQQYIDFLKRFPEPSGFDFYMTTLNPDSKCAPTDIDCRKTFRGIVASNFFRSPEFQRKGS